MNLLPLHHGIRCSCQGLHELQGQASKHGEMLMNLYPTQPLTLTIIHTARVVCIIVYVIPSQAFFIPCCDPSHPCHPCHPSLMSYPPSPSFAHEPQLVHLFAFTRQDLLWSQKTDLQLGRDHLQAGLLADAMAMELPGVSTVSTSLRFWGRLQNTSFLGMFDTFWGRFMQKMHVIFQAGADYIL